MTTKVPASGIVNGQLVTGGSIAPGTRVVSHTTTVLTLNQDVSVPNDQALSFFDVDTVAFTAGNNVTLTGTSNSIAIASTDQYEGTVTSVGVEFPQTDASGDPTMTGFVVSNSGSATAPNFQVKPIGDGTGTAGYYINGLGNPAEFPDIFAGTVTNVACTINGDAYTASVAAPTAAAAITIAPQGDENNYINGAGDLADVSQFVPTAGGVMTGDLKISEGTPKLTLQDSTANKGSLIIFRNESIAADATIYQSKGIISPTGSETYGSHIFQISDSVTPTTSLTLAADGSATFTGLVTGIAPTADLNFATKKYVDDGRPDGDITGVTAGDGMTRSIVEERLVPLH